MTKHELESMFEQVKTLCAEATAQGRNSDWMRMGMAMKIARALNEQVITQADWDRMCADPIWSE